MLYEVITIRTCIPRQLQPRAIRLSGLCVPCTTPLNFRRLFDPSMHVITSYSIHYTKLYEARDESWQRIVAAGGDGTLNEVVNGLAGSALPLAFIPLGTTNVFALETGIPFDVAQAAVIAVEAPARPVTLRITSYNVCYTKLLRPARGRIPP